MLLFPFLTMLFLITAAKLQFKMAWNGHLYVNDGYLYVNVRCNGVSYLKSKCFMNSSL